MLSWNMNFLELNISLDIINCCNQKKNILICEKESKILSYTNCKAAIFTYFLGKLYRSQQSLVVEDEVQSPD